MQRQRGIALLTAVVLVALATTLAVAIGFSSAMFARRSTAAFSVEQGLLFAEAAEAIAAYVLQQDKDRAEDDFAESWAQAYPPFEIASQVVLEAALEDEQGKFNLNTLLRYDIDKREMLPDEDAIAIFTRLLELAGVDTGFAPKLVDWLDEDDQTYGSGGEDNVYTGLNPPFRTGNTTISSISELMQLKDFSKEDFRKLAPLVTALPPEAMQINICTAPGAVLDALFAVGGGNSGYVEYSSPTIAAQMKESRTRGCFPTKAALENGSPKLNPAAVTRISTVTNYFRLRSWVSIGTTRFALYSLMWRNGQQIRPILRTFGTE